MPLSCSSSPLPETPASYPLFVPSSYLLIDRLKPLAGVDLDHKRIKTGAGSSQPLLRTFGPRQKVRETLVDEHALGGLAVLRVLVIFGAINVRLHQFVFRLAAVIRGAVEIRSEVPLVTSRLSH
jgi:hypothetical protein